MSPDLHVLYLKLEIVLRFEKERGDTGVRLDGRLLDNLRFADDIDLLADTSETLQDLTNRIDDNSEIMRHKINGGKPKTMAIGKQPEELQVKLGVAVLEKVIRF